MGLLSFIKEAGEKLFGGSSAQAAQPAGTDPNAAAAAAIKTYIETQNLGLSNLQVTYVATSGKVTLAGNAPSQEASEKAALAAGNVANVSEVDNDLIAPAAPAARRSLRTARQAASSCLRRSRSCRRAARNAACSCRSARAVGGSSAGAGAAPTACAGAVSAAQACEAATNACITSAYGRSSSPNTWPG